MPEYLAPGVYVEEVSFRGASIEGVSTSVTAFIGPTRYGPVGGQPELLTSFADFERIYGGLDPLQFEVDGGALGLAQPNYMAFAVRSFFDNGGTKLYVTRVYNPPIVKSPTTTNADGHASSTHVSLTDPGSFIGLRARFPGIGGSNMQITFAPKTTANLLTGTTAIPQLRGVSAGDVLFIWERLATSPMVGSPRTEGFYLVSSDMQTFERAGSGLLLLSDLDPQLYRAHQVTLSVTVTRDGRFEVPQSLGEFSLNPADRNALLTYFTDQPSSRDRYLSVPFAFENFPASGAEVAETLLGSRVDTLRASLLYSDFLLKPTAGVISPKPVLASNLAVTITLQGGSDGKPPTAESYFGDDSGADKTGLKTFEDIDEISILAAPGYSAVYDDDNAPNVDQIAADLITHCELMRYRVLVLDAPMGLNLSEVRDFRAQFDTKYAALYYPWLTMMDPLDPDGRNELDLPPSGWVTGIYARNDAERSVAKAPANEVPLGAIGLERLLNKSQQDILNPDGIDCFRYFPDRGFRLWGARTISSDPDWKYINVRRYFNYLEHSIDKGTQFAVFENNAPPLWTIVRQAIDDFLFNEWRNNNLVGAKPEDAFFVRCDRTTMTQNDLDNGRMVCLIGVSVNKPAEFVIFRIGQMTADSNS